MTPRDPSPIGKNSPVSGLLFSIHVLLTSAPLSASLLTNPLLPYCLHSSSYDPLESHCAGTTPHGQCCCCFLNRVWASLPPPCFPGEDCMGASRISPKHRGQWRLQSDPLRPSSPLALRISIHPPLKAHWISQAPQELMCLHSSMPLDRKSVV